MNKETPFCLSVNIQNNIFLLNCSLAFCYHMSYYNNQTSFCGKAKNHSEEVVLTTIQSLKNAFCQSASEPLTCQAASCTARAQKAGPAAGICSLKPHRRPGGSERNTQHRAQGLTEQNLTASRFALGGTARRPQTPAPSEAALLSQHS